MDLDTFVLDFEPEVLLIKDFSSLIRRDKIKGKPVAMAELAFVWFFCDWSSDFVQIIDEEERMAAIIEVLDGLPKGWKPDGAVLRAIDTYKKNSYSVAVRMLEDARTIIDNMSKWSKKASEELDAVIETKFGDKPKYDMTKVQSFITNLPKMITTLQELEERVLREKDMRDSHRGSQQKALFEDGEL